jgi:hypothetical protein
MSHTPRVRESDDGVRYGLKKIPIGDWDMDADAQKNVAHGLDASRIRRVVAFVRDDACNCAYELNGKDSEVLSAQVSEVNDTYVVLTRKTGQFFDSTDFDATSFNRGWVGIMYRLGT